jgi:leucyl/phenylalanyl-tRNA---protein transferase
MTHKARSSDVIPVDVLLSAYTGGYFPMSEPGSDSVQWYYSDPSAIIPLDSWRIPRSLKLFMKKSEWTVTSDRNFTGVIQSCSRRRTTWISESIKRSYINLHRHGHAHSIEVWDGANIVGGLYGVTLGGTFFGESMFSLKSNASKIALTALLGNLTGGGFTLLDIQMMTPVMEQFGAITIERERYLQLLEPALKKDAAFKPLAGLKPMQILEFIRK